MLDCPGKKESTVKSTYTTSFVPRQVLLSSSSSRSRMTQQEKENCSLTPQDRAFLLHTICQFFDLNGFSKTLKKLRGEANIEKDGWKNCSLNLEEIFQEHLRTCNEADKRTKENQVEKKSEATLENGTFNGDNIKHKKKKKNKSEPSDEDLKEKPVADTLSVPSEPVKKSKDKKKKHKDELEVLDKDLQGGKPSDKADDVSLEEKIEKSKSKKMKKDTSISKNEVDEDVKRPKKRKKSLSDDNATDDDEDDSKRRKMDDSDKLNEAAQPPKTPKGIMEKDGVEKAHKEDTTKETNGSVEPTSAKAFQRVKAEEVEFVDDRLKDNSYWAKDGADSGYGAKAQEVLGQVRGRDFRHEKTKKKRGTYRGGQIDLQSHSIKFNYDDEE